MITKLKYDVGKKLHKSLNSIGIETGFESCLKYDCEKYCGTSPSHKFAFWSNKLNGEYVAGILQPEKKKL